MTTPLLAPWLWAQSQNPLYGMGRDLRAAEQDLPWTMVLGAVAVIAAVALVVWLIVRYIKRRALPGYYDPQRMFRELCRAHELSAAQRRMLAQLASVRELKHPALLFVEPKHFDSSDLGDAWQTRQPALAALETQLFA